MALLCSLLTVQCSKEEEDLTRVFTNTNGTTATCEVELEILSDWTFDLNDTLTLLHTPGLETMALSGRVGPLNAEYCGYGELTGIIPRNLGDDIHNAGYASKITLGDYVIAMYHPLKGARDHFITYNKIDHSWIHWKLGNKPSIIIRS